MAVHSQDDSPRFAVDPNLEGGPQSVSVTGLPGDGMLFWRLTDVGPEVQGVVLFEDLQKVSETALLELPDVETDTMARVEAWLGESPSGEPDFVWSTFLRPGDTSLFTYEGPDSIQPPADFDAFWKRTKEELAAVEPNYEVNELEWGHTEGGLLYEVRFDSIGESRIVARFTIPRDAYDEEGEVVRRYPAMIVMPGYGAEQPPMDRTPSGFVTMSVNPRNHGPSREYWKAPGEHLIHGIEDPETYYYRLAFMDCLRAADYLFSRPEVDDTRVVAEGGSQGGLFAIALAALEPRIAAVVSNVTAFSALPVGNVLNTRGGSLTFNRLFHQEDEEKARAVVRSTSYTDGANLATRVRVPIQINMGGQDPVCHFMTGIVILNRLRADVPREFNFFPDIQHEVPNGMREDNARWVRMWLGLEGTPAFPGEVLSTDE